MEVMKNNSVKTEILKDPSMLRAYLDLAAISNIDLY